MNITLDSALLIDKENLDKEVERKLKRSYMFRENKTHKGVPETRVLYKDIIIDNKNYLRLPPNLNYFKEVLTKNKFNNNLNINDLRYAPEFNNFKSNIKLRENQQLIFDEMKSFDFNAIVSASTGFGKTTMSLYLVEKLKTSMLFIASRVNLILNLLKDIKQFNINEDDIIEINSEWLKNPVIKPIMYCTIQALSDEVLAELYGKVGLLVADEVHLGIGGVENIEKLYSINPKYRLYLSATYKNLQFTGLNECALSSNIIKYEEDISYKIKVKTIYIKRETQFHINYNKVYTSHEKKEVMYDELNIKMTANLAYKKVKKEGRGVLIYVESQEAQEALKETLQFKCLRVGLLNANTPTNKKKDIIDNFDNGDYDIIIAGNSISAGVSLYRLATIINLNITTNENNLEQLIGRLKRRNEDISNHNKEYYQVCVEGLSSKKWVEDIQCLRKFNYLEFDKVVRVDCSEFGLDNKYKIMWL